MMDTKLRDKVVRTLRSMGKVPDDVRDYSQLAAEDVAEIGVHDGYINVLLTDYRKVRLTAAQLDAGELAEKTAEQAAPPQAKASTPPAKKTAVKKS